MTKRLHKLLLFVALALMTVQCGSSKGKSANIEMKVLPAQPPVITGDFQNGNQAVRAPWFAFGVTVTNNSDSTITVIGLQLNVTAQTVSGTPITKQVTIMPSDFNYTYDCGGGTTVAVVYTDFGEIAAGATQDLFLKMRGPQACTVPTVNSVHVYAGGNPDMQNSHVVSYNYNVSMQPLGWFGTYAKPEDRLDKFVFFSTR